MEQAENLEAGRKFLKDSIFEMHFHLSGFHTSFQTLL